MKKQHQLKHISDKEVCHAVQVYRQQLGDPEFSFKAGRKRKPLLYPYETLALAKDLPERLTYKACERAHRHGLIQYGVSLRTGWLTNKGLELLGLPPTPYND